jgi:hypothetical protein
MAAWEHNVMRDETRFAAAVTRRRFLIWTGAWAACCPVRPAQRGTLEAQPYFASIKRALDVLQKLGEPVAQQHAAAIAALSQQGDRRAVDVADTILGQYTLASVSIGADRLEVTAGGAARTLVEQGWRLFLIRMVNPYGRIGRFEMAGSAASGLTLLFGRLTPGRMNGAQASSMAQRSYLFDTLNKAPVIEAMWVMASQPDEWDLSGIETEYRVIQLFSRDRGQRRAHFIFRVANTGGDRPADLRGHSEMDFECLPSRDVVLSVLDDDGYGCVASLTIHDKRDRIYPPQAMRIAPDLAFQPQVYRADGETVRLPDGAYTITSTRGPEYLSGVQTITIREGSAQAEVRLKRWIDPEKWGWYSGDTHIHAAGCAHYANPTEGVAPETMIRQIRGEGLSIGEILTWAPGWYYQKQFFTGHAQSPAASLEHLQLQAANNVSLAPRATTEDSASTLRYDVEVSGFPSSHAGHLVLLRLKNQDFPGAKEIEDWPSWNLPILRWAKAQGAVGGYAHCGLGMMVDSEALPNYEIPPMDGIGTQEAIVDVTHGLVDFLSGCDTEPVGELNAWYHLLNCGFRMAMLGETDYPCLSGERPGKGRTYVRLERAPLGDAGYEAWVQGMRQGRLYCGDGRSHFLDFRAHERRSGEDDVLLDRRARVNIEATLAAWLEPQLTTDILATRTSPGRSWHLENARISDTRTVNVELVVNGLVQDTRPVLADGKPRAIQFAASIARSSWIALRILSSSHTHPIFVQVAGRPIRASKRSAQWNRACVDKIWDVKSPFIRDIERAAAAEAFDHARATYDQLIAECDLM